MIIQIMANIGIAALLIFFLAVAARSVYLNLFCNNHEEIQKEREEL